ncbi:pimeloyl-ACP methyl ester carboxylesterase [Rhodopseudomonas rhenobacensis]|uniref:Pimeloyl-ACP methyl ester carboxylesterase n=1 Tax=Rhodopseudomonas rhenobacensis TaxID=87461 RepID=A0A7W7Z6M2_9BRAD|nr:alpha/beta fold hydrolase [Rhodopseudomonas rhenobacensis]MBB5048765.1 pimeloyl-ACP methyl ester carboxylesterase [Rhodopseudomonas rhenobacensis]
MHDRPSERGVMRRLVTPARWLVAVAALIGIAVALWQLQHAESGLRITTATVGETPVTVYRPQAEGPAPVVVIAHGFAGSQQLMQPFAVTLAQNGYVAVTFDFTGHGRNPVPMKGDVNEPTRITGVLVDELGRVADYAKTLPGTDGRLAVLGHSMASDIVVRYAMAHPEVTATVAVSVFSPVATASSPRNLLVIVGALEPNMLINEGLRIVNLATGGGAVAGQSYGDFADGSARRLSLSSGVEHIGVLYSRDSMAESLQWLNQAFGHQGSGFLDRRPPWLALLFGGLIALAWPLSRLLPKAAEAPMGANLRWKPLLAAAILPALLTPLILWKMPTDFLIILLGDYLTLHFLVYGVLTALILRFGNRGKPLAGQTLLWPGQSRLRLAGQAGWKPGAPNSITAQASLTYVAIAALAVGAYNIIAIGLPLDRYVFSFHPIAPRIHLILAVACGTVPYFITAEWLTRGDARRGAYALTKFCFLASLAIAVALNLYKLFFLIIIVPAILLLFLAFGLISHWSYKATNHPLPGALANAAVFAWAIAVTFPMVIR